MIRFLKLLKDRNRISSNLDRILKISAGFERLHLFLLILVLYLHVSACLLIMSSQFNPESNWVLMEHNKALDRGELTSEDQ
jgi:hypothetical protein